MSRKPPAGLTLVELVLTVTLFSTLLGAIAGLVRSGLSLQVRFGDQITPVKALERAMLRLETDLQAAVPHFGLPWTGTAHAISFARVEAGQWIQVTYRIEAEENGALALLRTTVPWGGAEADMAPPEVLARFTQARWAFLVEDAVQGRQWVEAWDGEALGIPKLVRFDYQAAHASAAAAQRVFRHPAGVVPVVGEQL